jgi:hypothetical protein
LLAEMYFAMSVGVARTTTSDQDADALFRLFLDISVKALLRDVSD